MKFIIATLVCLTLILGNLSSPTLSQTMPPPRQQMKMQKIQERVNNLPPGQRKEAIERLSEKLQRIKQRLQLGEAKEQRKHLEGELNRVTRELEVLQRSVEIISPDDRPGMATPPPPKRMGPKPDRGQIGLTALLGYKF